MRKLIMIAGILGLGMMQAQEGLVPQYPEELYQYNANALGGTARFKALSGAMGALGGDLSATRVNPAGGAVFIRSEAAITGALNTAKTNPANGTEYTDTEFDLGQIGAVFVFDDLNSADWKNVAIGMNYQKQNNVNEYYDITTNTASADVEGLNMTQYRAERYGESSLTNVTVSANYKDKLYIGAGMNFHTFESNSYGDILKETNNNTGDTYSYYKNDSENFRNGAGISFGVGVIGKVSQELRLGAAYKSPTWYTDVEEAVVYFSPDDLRYFQEYYVNDLVSPQEFTGSAALVLGKSGLITADYTYTDYSTAKFKPENAFSAENQFVSQKMNNTSTIRVGAEARLEDFRLRGGIRYEQTPFEETYQPFGDLTGFSVGAGYEFNGFYIDAAYDFFKRDRSYVISGDFYDYDSSYGDEYFSLNAEQAGYAQVIDDITEQQGNVSLSIGFRF